MRVILTTAICLFFLLTNCQTKKSKMDITTVKEFDLQKYMGTWYEIARFDHKFERGLQGVTATYSKRDDGKIKVLNQGYKGSLEGEKSTAVGKAKTTKQTGKLKVSFFWIFYANYLVMELEQNYQWALVGSTSDKYLWILSRTPQLEKETLEHILNKAQSRGYDTSKLIWVDQKSE